MPLWQTYSSPVFGIRFEYPANWQKVPGDVERYEGVTGFFQIDGLMSSEGSTIDEIAQSEGWDRIMPYVTPIRVDSLQIQGQEVRRIRPGADFLKAVMGQAWLLVQLARPIQVGGESYNYLLLWTDEDQVDHMAQTMRFL
jgi:TolB protein